MPLATHALVAAAVSMAMLLGSTGATYVAFNDVHRMPLGRSDMTVSPVRVGGQMRMYMAGGCAADQICYDPSSTMECFCGMLTNSTHYFLPSENAYKAAADMPRERYRHAAAEVDGTIYLFGGRSLRDDVITQVDAYDTVTDTWSTPCSWGAAGSDNTAFVDGSKIFLVGGWTADYAAPIGQLLEFDPAACTFTEKAPLPTPRGDVSSVSVGGRHFVMGGFANGDFCNGSKVIESYVAASDSWTSHQELKLGRADMAVGHIESHVFAIAGETVNNMCSRSIPVPDVERLDAGDGDGGHNYTADWVVEQEIGHDRFRFVATSFGTSIFLFGGQGAWTENIDGEGHGGFPIHDTALLYTPRLFGDGTNIFDGNDAAAAPIRSALLEALVAAVATAAASGFL